MRDCCNYQALPRPLECLPVAPQGSSDSRYGKVTRLPHTLPPEAATGETMSLLHIDGE